MPKPKPTAPTPEPMVSLTPAAVARLSEQLPDVSEDQITAVLTALNNSATGAPLHQVCRNPGTGEIAHRVDEGGLHRWRISPPDAPMYNNNEPNLPGWDVIYEA